MYFSAIGQDSHRFELENSTKKLVLGGVTIKGYPGLSGNSDADVILHAITNAVSGLTAVPVLGKIADSLCLEHGITDSRVYLQKALETLGAIKIIHCSISVEAKQPKISPFINAIRDSIASLLTLDITHVALTATTGEELTSFGKGEGIQVFVIVSAYLKDD